MTSAANDAVQWLVTDHLGTPRLVADLSGSLSGLTRHDYLPFGEEVGAGVGGRTSAQGYSQIDHVRQGFTGYERDAETGLNYAQARYYSSVQGRFTNPDDFLNDTQTNDPASWNLYAYVRNNPLVYTDPTGQTKKNKDGTIKFDAEMKDGKPVTEDREIGRGSFKDGRTYVVTANYTHGKVYADDGTSVSAMKYNEKKGVTTHIFDKEGNKVSSKTLSTEQAYESRIDPVSNCHGTTFAQGEVWINNDAGQVKALMSGDGYDIAAPTSSPSVGDVGLYMAKANNINTANHSVTIAQVQSGLVTSVISKNGAGIKNVNMTPAEAWKNDKLRYFTRKR